MNDNDDAAPDYKPTANGILLCLRMLMEEATSLNLRRTTAALRAAVLVAEAEAGEADTAPPSRLRLAVAADTRFN